MKKVLAIAAVGMLLWSCSEKEGTVTIHLPENFKEKTIVVNHVTIENNVTAKSADEVKIYYDTLEVKNGVAEMKLDPAGPARYDIYPPTMTMQDPEFYAEPGDHLEVTIKSFDPLDYTVAGSQLMEDMTAFNAVTDPIRMEYVNLMRQDDENVSPEQAKAVWDRYDKAIKKFVAEHPKSPVVPFAIMELSGDDFKEIYDTMTPEARKSILMPYAELYNKSVEEMQGERKAEEDRKAEVASGKNEAPGFTLTDLAGKKVSLSDFRGKWVVLDFWGSWCGWCIKGFPALKEAYEKYGDKLMIIGIDCNDSEEAWREAVKKHDLPWLQLYNGYDQELYGAYNITGFPTKAIINPEGKLVDLTTGEDPSFFDRLASFVK